MTEILIPECDLQKFERKLLPYQQAEIKLDDKKPGDFSGYGSTFGNVDEGKDIVAKGFFDDTVAAHEKAGTVPAMYYNHNPNEPVGDYHHAGKIMDRGLKMDGTTWQDSGIPKATQAYRVLKGNTAKGLSIGYITRKASYDEKTGVRTLIKGDLIEVSVVGSPMNKKAVITAVKGAFDDTKQLTIRDAEEILRDAGLSNSEAKTLVGQLHRAFDAQRDAEAMQRKDLDSLRQSLTNLDAALRGGK